MALHQAQVILQHSTLQPEDVSINTFWFDVATGVSPEAIDVWSGNLVDFYNDAGSTSALASLLSGIFVRGSAAHRIRWFNHEDPTPRQPVTEINWTLGNATSGDNLPNEVALCASFAAAGASGVNAARRRGRVFLGPFKTAAGTGSSTQTPRPSSSTMATVAEKAETLAGANDAQFTWVVYSRAGQSSSPVVRGWVNDEWDTQRRRQPRPTTRTAWSVLV